MTLNTIDHDLYITLLVLATRGNWEGYPTTVTEAPDAGFSPLLMWLRMGG